jgi:hypothetical protein
LDEPIIPKLKEVAPPLSGLLFLTIVHALAIKTENLQRATQD